jgi:hypothetical protein
MMPYYQDKTPRPTYPLRVLNQRRDLLPLLASSDR